MEAFRYSYRAPDPQNSVFVDAAWVDDIPEHIKNCGPLCSLELLVSGGVLRRLRAGGWSFGAIVTRRDDE